MLKVRPVKLSDLDQLLELASLATFGLTTLPHDAKLLEQRIRNSQRGFEKVAGDPPRGESYLLVMEDVTTNRVVGTCAIVSKVGGFDPFYAYRIEAVRHKSEMLEVDKEIRVLHLVAEHNGPCEIGGLFLAPNYRKHGNGRLLSLARFLLMARYPDHFDPVVIAEMRGVIDKHGRSAFWEALGKHFFEIPLPQADYLSVVDKRFVADLMPQHPIYIPLLSPEAQAVIGQVHEATRPALAVLEQEGFTLSGMVDIFDAGPVLTCARDEIRTVAQSVIAAIGAISDEPNDAPDLIIATTEGPFCACRGAVVELPNQTVRIDKATATTLGLEIGDRIRYAPLRSARSQQAT